MDGLILGNVICHHASYMLPLLSICDIIHYERKTMVLCGFFTLIRNEGQRRINGRRMRRKELGRIGCCKSQQMLERGLKELLRYFNGNNDHRRFMFNNSVQLRSSTAHHVLESPVIIVYNPLLYYKDPQCSSCRVPIQTLAGF